MDDLGFLGFSPLGSTLQILLQTRNPSGFSPINADALPTWRVYGQTGIVQNGTAAALQAGSVTAASYGHGCTITVAVSGGAIILAGTSIANGGSGYPPSATFNLAIGGGTGGILSVSTSNTGVVNAINSLVAGGSGYSAATETTTNTNPIIITSAGHGLVTGSVVTIAGVGGNTNANGTFAVTVIDQNNFSISATGNASYTSGGTWSSTGLYSASIPATQGNGYASGVTYTIEFSWTVSSANQAALGTFTIT